MGHGFILPVQFGIEDGAGINLQCADQRENDLPGWISDAIFNFAILTFVSRLHFGQYNGKFSKTVSVYTFIRVLLLQ